MLAGGRAALLRCMYQTAQRNAVTGKSMRPLIASMTHPVANNQRCYGTNTVESLIHDIVTPTKKSVDLLEKHEPLVSSFKDLNAKDLKESFELLTAEIADELPKKSPEGECLVVVLSLMQNQDLLRNEQIKSLCIDLLRKQNFNALGYIASFAKKLNLPWLRLAVIEKIEAAIPELGTQSRADVHSAYVYLSMGLVSQETSLILDARLHAFMDKLNFQAMVKILHTFAVMNRRNMDVINPLVFAMSCKSATVTPTQLTNLYYASSTLKGLLSHGQLHTTSIVDIYDRAFKTKCLRMTTTDNDGVLTFDKLPSGRMRAIKYRLINKHMLEILEQQTLTVLQTNLAIQDDHIISMILSMGKMKWNSPSTLTVLCEYLNDMEKLTAREYSSILTTCTVIGCLPPPVQKGLIRQLQTSSINPKAVGDYLNIAWCMLRFDLHSEAILRDLLSDEKISRLVDGKPAYTRTVMCSKLLNLATVARNQCNMEMPSQLLGVEMSKPKLNLSAFHNQLADMLVKCLECDIAHVERGLWYPTGHIIDFRYLFDTQFNSVVMPHMYAAPGDLNTTNKQSAPDSMKWVAVLANSYQEMTTGVKEEPLAEGRRVLAANQLKKLGYHVITIQDNSFIGEPDTEKRQKWLKEQLAIDK